MSIAITSSSHRLPRRLSFRHRFCQYCFLLILALLVIVAESAAQERAPTHWLSLLAQSSIKQFEFSDVNITIPPVAFSPIILQGKVRRVNERLIGELKLSSPGTQIVSLGLGSVKFEFQVLREGSKTVLRVPKCRGTLFSGEVFCDGSEIFLEKKSGTIPILLRGVSLAALLESYPKDGLVGSGLLDGVLPLILREGKASVDGGYLVARDPGGVIQFDSGSGAASAGSVNSGFELALEALRDYHFQSLSSVANYSPEGVLRLSVELRGNNPSLRKGQPINFNLNIEENVPALIKSLGVGQQISKDLGL